MAVIFLDTFTGSGHITSHTADTGADGAWLTPPGDGEPEIAGGEVYSAGGTDAANAPTSFAMAPFTIEAECASLGIDGGLLVGVFGLDGADLAAITGSVFYVSEALALSEGYVDGEGFYVQVGAQGEGDSADSGLTWASEITDVPNRMVVTLLPGSMSIQIFGTGFESDLLTVPLAFDATVGTSYQVRFVIYDEAMTMQTLTVSDAEVEPTVFWTDIVGALEVA